MDFFIKYLFLRTELTDLRKTLSISLILLLFMSQAGYYLYYTFQLQAARSEIKEQLESGIQQTSLELIIQEDNDLTWQEDGKEFYINGRLYDVARKEIQNGRTLLYCLPDINEQDLVQDLSSFLKAGTESNNDGKATHYTLKFQLNDYILHAVEKNIFSTDVLLKVFPSYSKAISSMPSEVEGPPPRV